MLKFTDELRSLLGNVLLRLQSSKVLGRLPAAFHEVPLHRDILLTRGNARTPLPVPGSEEYDDRQEDLHYQNEASEFGADMDYAKEYTERLDSSNTKIDSHWIRPERNSGVIWYSELPEPEANDEVPIVSVELRDALDALRGKVSYHLQRYEVGEAAQSIVDVLTLLNKDITRIQPWSEETRPREVLHILTWGREILRICGILLHPFMPNASQALLDALHVNPRYRTYAYARIGAGRVRSGPMERSLLFPNKRQKAWKEVEADHKWEENMGKRKLSEQTNQAGSFQCVSFSDVVLASHSITSDKLSLRFIFRMHRPRQRKRRRRRRPNKLYLSRFDPYGSPEAPDRGVRRKWRTKLSILSVSPDVARRKERRKYYRELRMVKREKQKKREPF